MFSEFQKRWLCWCAGICAAASLTIIFEFVIKAVLLGGVLAAAGSAAHQIQESSERAAAQIQERLAKPPRESAWDTPVTPSLRDKKPTESGSPGKAGGKFD